MTKQSLFDESPDEGTASEGTGRITAVDPMPSNPNLKRVKVDGKVAARLSASAVEALRIEVGRKWTASLASRAENAMERAKAHRAAMTMLGKRALSRGELIERLVKRGHSMSTAQGTADDLEEHRWLDDEAYSMALAEELVSRKGASREFIVDRLTKRRIDEAMAKSIADRALDEIDQAEAAAEFARRRLATMKGVEPPRAARRIAAALARRGYDDETVSEALRRGGLGEVH